MKVLILTLAVLTSFLGLSGCGKGKDDVPSAVPASTPSAPISRTREQVRMDAVKVASSVASSAESSVKTVDLTSLLSVRKKVGDFYALHLGLPSSGIDIPDRVDVSFDQVMAGFWETKARRENVSDATLHKVPEILGRYMKTDRGYTTLPEFVVMTEKVVARAKDSVDWDRLCNVYKMPGKNIPKQPIDKKRCALAKEIVKNLHGKDFIAYGMTELLPGDSRLNVAYLDMLLRNAGVSYIMHIPAVHDNMLSLGFYQFTSFALRKDDEATEGASIVSKNLKPGGVKIPESVVLLQGDDHHVGAVYFAVHNVLRMVSFLSDHGVAVLSRKHKDFQDEMVMFVASAHHLPGYAYHDTKKWVEGGMKGDMARGYRKANRLYADKTRANLIALYGMK